LKIHVSGVQVSLLAYVSAFWVSKKVLPLLIEGHFFSWNEVKREGQNL
jgi:hypothetical protein